MRNLRLLILVFSLAVTVSCAKEKKATSSNSVPSITIPSGSYVPPTTGPGGAPGSYYGGSAALTITSLAVMSDYTGRPMNNPQNITINLNMIKTSGGTFGGTTTISYTDNGVPYQGYFTAGSTSQATQFNVAYSNGGNMVWHGVFEDFMGGLVVVIDQIVDLGDGGTPDKASGSVWYKNFGLTYAPHPPTYCWFVSLGPYDCRPWPSGKGMNTYQNVEPQAGYIKLGTFSNLSLKAAFNNEKLY